MKSFLNTCNLFWSADFKGNSCVIIYHDSNFNVYTFTDPMPEKIFGSLRVEKKFPKNFLARFAHHGCPNYTPRLGLAVYHHTCIMKLSVCWCVWKVRRKLSRSGLNQDIKLGSFVFHCNVPQQQIAQRQVGPVSVYCARVGCHVLCLLHGIPA